MNRLNKILIADDEPFVRLLLEQTLEDLENENLELLTATDGEEALEVIIKEKPQLVFLDIMMPKLNGFEVCQVVKHRLAMDNTYVVLLTAKGQELDKQRGAEVGAYRYLTKPFNPDEIVEITRQILGI
jgi:two-component system, OmpR family, alkaline phosphatase synthesis response regulator PhoP